MMLGILVGLLYGCGGDNEQGCYSLPDGSGMAADDASGYVCQVPVGSSAANGCSCRGAPSEGFGEREAIRLTPALCQAAEVCRAP